MLGRTARDRLRELPELFIVIPVLGGRRITVGSLVLAFTRCGPNPSMKRLLHCKGTNCKHMLPCRFGAHADAVPLPLIPCPNIFRAMRRGEETPGLFRSLQNIQVVLINCRAGN